MKRVVAIIQPFKLEEVEEALLNVGVPGLNMTDVMGFGHQREPAEIYRDTGHAVSFVAKVKVEVVVPTNLVDRVIEAIMKSAGTGQIGDGKIFVADIERALRIRTGEIDNAAL
jgi:nitrogen regulatory protein P-II 2